MTTTSATNYWTATAAATAASSVVVVTKPRHTPGFKLTPDERAKKGGQHKFGLCCACDAGLDDRTDFHVEPRENCRFALMCNACANYYTCADDY